MGHHKSLITIAGTIAITFIIQLLYNYYTITMQLLYNYNMITI